MCDVGFETLKQSSGQDITEMLVQHCVTEFAMKSKLSVTILIQNFRFYVKYNIYILKLIMIIIFFLA